MPTYAYFIPFIVITLLFILVMKTEKRTIMTGVLFVLSLVALFGGMRFLLFKYSETIDAMLPAAATVRSISTIVMAIIGLLPTAMIIITFVSAAMIIKREGLSSQNSKTLGFAVLLLIYTAVFPIVGKLGVNLLFDVIYAMVSMAAMYFILLKSMYTMTSIINQIHRKGGKNLDYILYIGAGMKGDKAEPLTKKRIEKTFEIWQENSDAKIVVTGGSEKYEEIPRTEEIAARLEEKGIPADKILTDENSHNTDSDIRFGKKKIEEDLGYSIEEADTEGLSRRKAKKIKKRERKKGILNTSKAPGVALISSNYHVLRCLITAKYFKMKCIGYGAPVRVDYRMNAFVNEYYRYLRVSRSVQIKVMIIIALIWILLLAFVLIYTDIPLLYSRP